MNALSNLLKKFTWILVGILTVILIYTTLEFIAVVIRTMINSTEAFILAQRYINVEELFLQHVQELIAGILMITIIIELIKTLLATLDKRKRNNYMVIFFEIATIAVIRHLFIYELDHLNGMNVIGIAALLLILGTFVLIFRYNVLKRFVEKKNDYDES